MKEDTLIGAIIRRATDPTTRTDWPDRDTPELAPCATLEQVERAEQVLKCKLHPLHRRLLQEVGNGGFGPANGIIGLPGGKVDDDGRSVVELREQLFADATGAGVPAQVVPLCDWGSGTWWCVDEDTGHVLMLDETGLADTQISLHDWMADWVNGVSLAESLFTFEERSGINPFTKTPMTARLRSRPIGVPYRGRTS
ncbi:SMI1/KNR4 family protein [Sorangium sp. So ce1504]|uniref:SMI1/KNR4 family protein n=1 Tax=Sorangium sp. So ce1504 TaxID=3133337 RepID=UPI003F61D0ED